jgi:hypothetical protein
VRDSAVDLVKAACLLVVVGLHAMMAGVTVGQDGLTITNALAGHPIFAWTTWAVQVMPLFFLLGGFSSLTQWRRMQASGATAGDYIRQRVNRLARPALLPIALVGATLASLALTGIPGDVLKEVGFKIGQPLWFLAVYLGCSGFIPLLARLHDRAPRTTLAVLLGTALLVDTISVTFHLPAVAALNLLFVWLFIQQLGFWYADGWFQRRSRWLLLGGTVASYAVLVLLTVVIGYSKDMYENLNPPTTCILVLGIAQIFLVGFARPYLARLGSVPAVRLAASAVNRNSMTIYLWHVPVVVVIAVTMLYSRMPMPEPLSPDWWQSRPLFLIAIAIALVPVVLIVDRRKSAQLVVTHEHTHAVVAGLKVVLSVAGVATILVIGFTPVLNWAIGMALLVAAVAIGPRRVRALRPTAGQSF